MAAERPAGPTPMMATSTPAFGSGGAPSRSSSWMNFTQSVPSFVAFLMSGAPDTSPMM
jgi:hypothetical protein